MDDIKEVSTKNIPKTSFVKSISATLINDSGNNIAIFKSSQAKREKNKIVYTFRNAKFNQEFIFIVKLNKKLFGELDNVPREIKIKFFNGKAEYTYGAVYDKESDYYCILDGYAVIQLLAIEIPR